MDSQSRRRRAVVAVAVVAGGRRQVLLARAAPRRARCAPSARTGRRAAARRPRACSLPCARRRRGSRGRSRPRASGRPDERGSDGAQDAVDAVAVDAGRDLRVALAEQRRRDGWSSTRAPGRRGRAGGSASCTRDRSGSGRRSPGRPRARGRRGRVRRPAGSMAHRVSSASAAVGVAAVAVVAGEPDLGVDVVVEALRRSAPSRRRIARRRRDRRCTTWRRFVPRGRARRRGRRAATLERARAALIAASPPSLRAVRRVKSTIEDSARRRGRRRPAPASGSPTRSCRPCTRRPATPSEGEDGAAPVPRHAAIEERHQQQQQPGRARSRRIGRASYSMPRISPPGTSLSVWNMKHEVPLGADVGRRRARRVRPSRRAPRERAPPARRARRARGSSRRGRAAGSRGRTASLGARRRALPLRGGTLMPCNCTSSRCSEQDA